MITPALLLSATGTFILSTSNRLGRCVDRVRKISELLDEDIDPHREVVISPDRKKMLMDQVDVLARRSRILQRTMQALYLAAAAFVATSVSIGVASIFVARLSWVPITMGLGGACFLAFASIQMIIEARLSAIGLASEVNFILQGVERHIVKR